MSILSYSTQPDGLIIHCDSGWYSLSPYTSSLVRIRYNQINFFPQKTGWIVNSYPDQDVSYTIHENGSNLIFSTSRLTILIDKITLAFTYLDNNGNLLTKEPSRGGKTLEPIDVYLSNFDEMVALESHDYADGVRIDTQNIKQIFNRKAFHTKLEFNWEVGEALYGLGSHEEGIFNLRGQHQYLYQQNMKAVVPVFISTRGYGVFFDSYSLMTFHDDAFGSYFWSDVNNELDYYFIIGPEFDQIIYQLRELTGQTPMLPKWSFGYIQSKERYTSSAELIDIVSEYRRRKLPLDCIVLDWKSWTGKYWGQKSLDPERFPQPTQMTMTLHQMHAHLMVSIWPIMRPGGENWNEMNQNGYLLGNQATYNAFNKAARECYWKQTNDGLFSYGVDAWWCDCTEPFEADWKGEVKPEPEERLRINTDEAKKYIDPEFINGYSLQHSKGIYEGQRRITNRKRVVNLTRSAYLGQQRYASITWSGDVSAKWEVLRRQIADGLNFCATGMPYWTTDIGGFFVKRKKEMWFWNGDFDLGVDDMAYREMFVRWFQFGTFLPMLRSHGTDTPREIWRFGEPGEPMYDALVKFLNLRYRLLPYIYTLAGWTTHYHYTMMRLLAFDFRDDPVVYDIGDQYMFGPALMVNPVTTPMYYTNGSNQIVCKNRSRKVYLPKGCIWYDFWTDKKFVGGQTLRANASLERIPLFVRGGSIIPLGPVIQYVDECTDPNLEIHIYPGRDVSFLLYEDEGDGYNYENGAFSSIKLKWIDTDKNFIIEERVGHYDGMSLTRSFFVILHSGTDGENGSEGLKSERKIDYEGKQISIFF
jgi:alpha-D-xyloside xylohydrolase